MATKLRSSLTAVVLLLCLIRMPFAGMRSSSSTLKIKQARNEASASVYRRTWSDYSGIRLWNAGKLKHPCPTCRTRKAGRRLIVQAVGKR